jgi:hypothetical protein
VAHWLALPLPPGPRNVHGREIVDTRRGIKAMPVLRGEVPGLRRQCVGRALGGRGTAARLGVAVPGRHAPPGRPAAGGGCGETRRSSARRVLAAVQPSHERGIERVDHRSRPKSARFQSLRPRRRLPREPCLTPLAVLTMWGTGGAAILTERKGLARLDGGGGCEPGCMGTANPELHSRRAGRIGPQARVDSYGIQPADMG